MTNAKIGIQQSTSPDRQLDNELVNVDGDDVYRQRIQAAGVEADEIVKVRNSTPGDDDYGWVTRSIGVISDLNESVKGLLRALTNPMWVRQATGAIRIVPETSTGTLDTLSTVSTVTTVTTVTTCSTLTNQSQWGTYPLKQTMMDATEEIAWQQAVRDRIT